MELAKFAGLKREELSWIEVAYAILEETGEVSDFTALLEQIQDYLGFSDEVLEARMARFYTDMNIDGRFISLGENRWGLRSWYPIDSIDEEIVSSIDDEDLPRQRRAKKAKHNVFDEDGDMIDYNADDPEDIDGVYDNDDYEDDEDEEDLDEVDIDTVEDDDEEDTKELDDYESDLSELGDDEIDIDEEGDFDEDLEDDEDYADEDEDDE